MAKYRAGFAAIIGKPNSGKSTLINALVNKKIAIVSDKPETTRDNIRGIVTDTASQIVFVDTPGIHRPHLLLGKLMVNKAANSMLDADIIIFMVDASTGLTEADDIIVDKIRASSKPAVVAINKIDTVSKSRILPIIDSLKDKYPFKEFIPISAATCENLGLLKNIITNALPDGARLYDGNEITDKDDIFIVSEIIREKAIYLTKEEVPHSVAVAIENFQKNPATGALEIDAVIYIERDSQKGILIGQKGSMIKRISTLSRKELEKRFGEKVSLQVNVNVLEGWRRSERALKKLGIH
ncbi:MAG: GTPase Era [Candidatus Omnitrophica bacterium]|nr:GTPase Era [Candidatus Omnitrophota bacterium]